MFNQKKRCKICKSVISPKADICLHCGHPERRENLEKDDSEAGIVEYARLKPAYPWILITFFFVTYFFVLLFFILHIAGYSISLEVSHYVFLLYISLFTSSWIVYFNSHKRSASYNFDYKSRQAAIFKIRSLRRLLSESSIQWKNSNKEIAQIGLEDSFRRKSSTSMQVLAILIAVTVLLMDRVSNLISANSNDATFIENGMLYLSGFSSIVSFICFVISVDALDVVFNKFYTARDRHLILQHYYQSTINPRYFGMLGMILGIIFLAAYHDPLAGCFAVGVTFFIGYYHWFPDIPINNQETQNIMNNSFRIFLWLLMLVPIVLLISNA
ncbi:hypothetical protein SAMN05216302_10015 [Nitrosomonas aestuarii]|uniref:Uncharacterized protein n=1 Tax=Nitrosomonas aestuarii TaxID=52441 RepID=A0A1I3WVX0_9PROT|nr:hypothetical protein [Nitrosomonas aestuarii]SFK11674.1 hypothetical protein SAMN05216302_10015 [Nitrosomonas aestuarii]